MSRRREVLRPEDATSLEEFQARRAAEVRQLRESSMSWKVISRPYMAGVLGFIDIFLWYLVARSSGAGRWIAVIFALCVAWLALRFLIRSPGRGLPETDRERELNGLAEEWQVKADRGEIPQAAPGGLRIWRDEVESRIG